MCTLRLSPRHTPSTSPAPTHANYLPLCTPLCLCCSRRYACGPCIFKLCREARAAATHGLYIDGDLAASELIAFIEACHRCGLPCHELTSFVDNRTALLEQLGTIHPAVATLGDSERRDFAKAVTSQNLSTLTLTLPLTLTLYP